MSLIINNSYSKDFKSFNDSVFNSWGIGDSILNNGVLLGIDVENKQIAVSIGSGISEPYVNFKPFWEIVVDSININCKRGDYFNALKNGSIMAGEYAKFRRDSIMRKKISEEHNVYVSNPKDTQTSKEKYFKGKKMMDEGNYVDGWRYVLEAAKEGYGKAQDEAGSMYYNGHIDSHDKFVGYSKNNNEINMRKGYEWWKKAAEQNIGFSQLMLGDAYLHGSHGFPIDTLIAVKYYKKAKVNGCKRWASQALENIPRKYQ